MFKWTLMCSHNTSLANLEHATRTVQHACASCCNPAPFFFFFFFFGLILNLTSWIINQWSPRILCYLDSYELFYCLCVVWQKDVCQVSDKAKRRMLEYSHYLMTLNHHSLIFCVIFCRTFIYCMSIFPIETYSFKWSMWVQYQVQTHRNSASELECIDGGVRVCSVIVKISIY